jgi:hypothetical protein
VEHLQLPARLEAELLGEQAPGFIEGAQRLGLAPRSVEHAHLQPAEAFAQRIGRDQGTERSQRAAVIADEQHRLDAVLLGGGAEFVQPRDLGGGERFVGEVGQRVAAPQPERGVECSDRAGRVAGLEGAARVAGQALESEGIDLVT